MSPILFTVFMNTIFDGDTDNGCDVSGVVGSLMTGLMFVDDTVGISGDKTKLYSTYSE